MSKKSKTKKVSQNDLRKMMNDMKSKRTATNTERKTLATDSDAYRKALKDQQRIDALKKGIQPQKDNSKHLNLQNSTRNNTKKTAKRHFPGDSEGKDFKEPLPKVAKVAKEIKKDPGGLLLGDYGSSSEEEDEDPQRKKEEPKKADIQTTEESNPSSSLPEGFFDDAEVDAKIRGVETPSSAMDREWEDFQREIQKETGQSEQIIDEGQEIEKVDREIEEITEQILHFSRVKKLNITHDKVKEKLKNREPKKTEPEAMDEDSESNDEIIDEDLLDWREKDF